MRCLLIGNFGVGNLGDEALQTYFLKRFPEVDWMVLSAHPKGTSEIPRLPGGIRSLLSLKWMRTLGAYRKCDGVVFGGGSLFTDTESLYACLLWWMYAAVAGFFRKPVHLAFQGIGPFRSWVGERIARSVVRRAATVSVRDKESLDRINSWSMNKKIVLTCDPVLWLIKNEKQEVRTENILVLIPRKNSSEKFTIAAQNAVSSSDWKEIRILSLEPQSRSENLCTRKLAAIVGPRAALRPVRSLQELLSAIAPARLVVSERYHGALAAFALGKETKIICQRKGDKLQSLQSESNIDPEIAESGAEMLQNAMH